MATKQENQLSAVPENVPHTIKRSQTHAVYCNNNTTAKNTLNDNNNFDITPSNNKNSSSSSNNKITKCTQNHCNVLNNCNRASNEISDHGNVQGNNHKKNTASQNTSVNNGSGNNANGITENSNNKERQSTQKNDLDLVDISECGFQWEMTNSEIISRKKAQELQQQ